jgi:hypothetical protein
MFESRIHFLGPAVDLTLIQCAEEIYRVQYEVSKFFEKQEWIMIGRVDININNKEDTIAKIMKDFKKDIRRNTVLKDIPDNYMGTGTSLLVYYLKYSDDSLIFRYLLGSKSEISRYSETLIYNYEILIDILGFTAFKEFIKNMVGLLNATIIEVPGHALADELQKLLGTSVNVRVINTQSLD